jgi:hypothetical protein
MGTQEGVFRFVKVTKETLFNFLQTAKKRIVIAKPGYFKEEVEALIEIVHSRNIECNVFIDPSDNAVRFGFGEIEALKIIKDQGSMLHCQTASHIRMSVVIVDDQALIYVPVALAWENESQEFDYPNGIIGGQEFAKVVFDEFILQEKAPPIPEDQKIFQETVIKQINEIATQAQLEQSIEKLTKNPPVDPSKLEEFTFYRNNFKILKTEIRGVKIENKSISLRPFTRLLPKIDKRLKNSWQVFTREEVKNLEGHKTFLRDVNKVWTYQIEKRNLFNIQRHGHLIRTPAKGEFEKQLKEQKEKFMQALKSEEEAKDDGNLSGILLRSKKDLIAYIFTNIKTIEESWHYLFKHNKILFREFQKAQTVQVKDEIFKKVIESFVQEELHFPEIDNLIEAVDIKCDYYDVSDELLRDEEFSNIMNNQGLHDEIRHYGEGYKQQSLFEKD